MWRLGAGRWRIRIGRISGRMTNSIPLGSIFLAGLVAGILAMNMGKSVLLENTGLLDESILYHMKYMTVDSSALFYYVLRNRLKSVFILGILATTYLGLAVCVAAAFWYGMSFGAFLTALVIRYGLKGIFFALAGMFPQYLLYAPALAALLTWCEETNRNIYFRRYYGNEEEKHILPGRIFKFLLILFVVVVGCMLEGFCNPYLMLGLLKIF